MISSAQSCSQSQNFVNTSKKPFPIVHYFIRQLELVSNILWMIIEQCMALVKVSLRFTLKTKIEIIYLDAVKLVINCKNKIYKFCFLIKPIISLNKSAGSQKHGKSAEGITCEGTIKVVCITYLQKYFQILCALFWSQGLINSL